MGQRCDICGKGPRFGNRISHAHNVRGRRWNVNLRRRRVNIGGVQRRVRVCTECLRRGRLAQPA